MVSKGHTCVWPFYELCRGTTNTDKQNDTNFCIFFQVFWKFCRRFLRAAIRVLWLLFLLIFFIMVSKGHTCVWPFYELCRGTTNTNKQNDNFCIFFQVFWKFCRRFFRAAIWVLWLLFLLTFLIMVSKGHTCEWPFYELCRGTTNTNKQNDTNFCNFFQVFWKFCRRFFCRLFLRAAIWVLWLLFLLIFLIMVSKGHTCVLRVFYCFSFIFKVIKN